MIVRPSPVRDAAAAARRAGLGRLPVWLASPGDRDVGVEREVVACDPARVVRGSSLEELEDAWAEARARWQGAAGVPVGIGYLGYDLGRSFERLRGRPPEPSGWPDLEFRFYDALWTSAAGQCQVWACDESAARPLEERLRAPADEPESAGSLAPLEPVDAPEQHVASVRRILEYLRAGDAYQVNLARRLAAAIEPGDPPGLALFARLQRDAPAPHAFWMADAQAGSCLVGNSPERFLRVTTDGVVETRPIKGTRPRRPGAEDDLARHPKDAAEHAMIVDLERNDLGRVCETGTVITHGVARVVSLPTVHHLVTTVRGRLRAGVALRDLLRATFPGGSVTGAPKIRAMEIIDELEPARRGPYTGATGWLGAAGDLDLSVAIRTALVRDRRLLLWVGGGIVVDSDPADELRETQDKAAAFDALALPRRKNN